MSGKISGRVLPTQVDIFHSLCVPHAALHLGNSCEKLNVPVLWREQNYGNEGCVITWDVLLGFFSMPNIPHHMACFLSHIKNRGMKRRHILKACPQTMDIETPRGILDFIIYAINYTHPFVKAVTPEPGSGRELILRFPSKLSVLTIEPSSYC